MTGAPVGIARSPVGITRKPVFISPQCFSAGYARILARLMATIVEHTERRFLGSRFYVWISLRLLGESWFHGLSRVIVGRTHEDATGFKSDILGCSPDDAGIFSWKGFYYFATDDEPPQIEIYLDEIYAGIPFFLRPTPLMILRITRVLSHEAAHHQLRIRGHLAGLDSDGEETLANRFARFVEVRICRSRFFRFWRWILRDLSGWYFARGCADMRWNKLDDAEKNFYRAWEIDGRNQEAADWFWTIRSAKTSNDKT